MNKRTEKKRKEDNRKEKKRRKEKRKENNLELSSMGSRVKDKIR